MARRKRTSFFTPTIDRTIERVAIAALAAVATKGENISVAYVAITIFIIVAVVEELGRGWVWNGTRVTLRDVAFSDVGRCRLLRARNKPGRKRRRRRTRLRSGVRAEVSRKRD